MISDFIKSEPDLSNAEVLDELIYEALSKLFMTYGGHPDDDYVLKSDYWRHEELEKFESNCVSITPLEFLSKIDAETKHVVDRITIPFEIKLLSDLSKKQIKEMGFGTLYDHKDRPLYNFDNKYSHTCAALALRILIPMRESSKVNTKELVTAVRLIQSIYQCNMLSAITKQTLAETVRNFTRNNVIKKNKTEDEKPINILRKRIVQQFARELLNEDDSLSMEVLVKKVRKSYNSEIDRLILAGEINAPDQKYDIRYSMLRRWLKEAKTDFEDPNGITVTL